jgi:hypothetical protein
MYAPHILRACTPNLPPSTPHSPIHLKSCDSDTTHLWACPLHTPRASSSSHRHLTAFLPLHSSIPCDSSPGTGALLSPCLAHHYPTSLPSQPVSPIHIYSQAAHSNTFLHSSKTIPIPPPTLLATCTSHHHPTTLPNQPVSAAHTY